MTPSTSRFLRPSLTAAGRWSLCVLSGLGLAASLAAGAPGWGPAADRPSRAEAPLPKDFSFDVAKDSAGDPIGDTFGTGPTQIDITGLAGEAMGDSVVVQVTFDGTISPPDSGQPDAVNGFIDIDADQDGSTGDVPWTDFLTGSATTGMGNEFYVDLFSYSAADGAADVVDDLDDTVTGRAPVSFTSSSMTVQIPLALLADAEVGINTAAVLGTFDEATDAVPNDGSVAIRIPGAGPCGGSPTSVLLNGGRFRVNVDWSAVPDYPDARPACVSDLRTDATGIFYFLDPNNLELVIKVLDGCSFNDRYWVFFAGVTDVELTVAVTDTQTGETRQYFNTQGHPADAVTNTSAFTCP